MKKLLFIGAIVTLFSVAASAQQVSGDNFRHQRKEEAFRKGQLTRSEMHRLHKTHRRTEIAKHRAFRDGKINRMERHRLHKMNRHERREFFRFKHNRRHRVI